MALVLLAVLGVVLIIVGLKHAPVLTLVAIPVVPILGYLVVYGLARANIFWTIVEQGWCRIILKWGEYHKTVGPGLRWIGIPGMYALYRRKMTFLKSVTNQEGKPQAEPHKDRDVGMFKTTDYAYAFPFRDEEDSHGLNLSGMLAVVAVIDNYQKAFFVASDWYASMNTEIMPCFRDTLVRASYDDDIVGRDTTEERIPLVFSERIWRAMRRRRHGDPSVVRKLLDLYGIRVKSIELRSIDPPDDWRATTLAPYKAARERAAATEQAMTSAELFDDTNQAFKKWFDGQRAAGENPTAAQIKAKQEELRDRALAKTPGYQQVHVKGLEGATTAVVGGGAGAGILVGGQGGGSSKRRKRIEDMTDDELHDDADDDD